MNMGVYMGVCEIIELDNYYIYQLNIIQYPILQGYHLFSAIPNTLKTHSYSKNDSRRI